MRPSRLRHLVIADDLLMLQQPNVQAPDAYGAFLAESIILDGVTNACDLTTGCGYHALCLAANGVPTVAVDKSAPAVELTTRNALINGLHDFIDARQGDLYEALKPNESFDCIVSWPPVMPTPEVEEANDWWATANSGGPRGRDVLDKVIVGAPQHLAPGGSLWLAHPWYLSSAETLAMARSVGLQVVTVATRRFLLGVVSRSRLPYIRSLGFAPIYDGLEPMQELAILRICASDTQEQAKE